MRKAIGCLLILPSLVFGASPYFEYCEVAFTNGTFEPLRDLLRSEQIEEVSQCMRLTSSEYLVTANPAGPYNGPASNLFYCNLKDAEVGCREDNPSYSYPNLTEIRQFTGPRGKQYVLWSTESFRGGVLNSGYYIFNLVPKSVASRGYIFYSLEVGTHTARFGDGGDDNCTALGAAESTEIVDVEILEEGTDAVAISFDELTRLCGAKDEARRKVRFILRNEKFEREQTSTGREVQQRAAGDVLNARA